MESIERIYLDYAATSPIDPAVLESMLPFLKSKFGNSASLHSYGQEAYSALEESRKTIADALHAKPREIIFSSSATESNNLALKGVALANREKGRHIIISSVEHDCVINSAKWLEKMGFSVTKVPADKFGMISANEVKKAIRDDTILVSVMHANNEIGTINPIAEIGRACREKGIYFHTDASQSFGKIPINVEKMNIDLLTASSHKMYGPKGAALLYVREGINIEPLLNGGGHEFGLRSSTVNVPAIVGFSKAVTLCISEIEQEGKRETIMRDMIIKEILEKVPDSKLNGHPVERLPNNINVRFDFVEGESLLMYLDSEGIAVSTASACSSPKLEPSHVLMACGLRHQESHGSLRISIGRFTTDKEIEKLLDVLPKAVMRFRQISPFKRQGE